MVIVIPARKVLGALSRATLLTLARQGRVTLVACCCHLEVK